MKKGLECRDGDLIGMRNLARLLWDNEQRMESERVLRECVEDNPHDARSYLELSRYLRRQGDVKSADALLRQAIESNPERDLVWGQIGVGYLHLEEFEKARECFLGAIRLNDKNPMHHSHLADSLENLGRFEEALEAAHRCHELGQADPNRSLPSEPWLDRSKRLAIGEQRLEAILAGTETEPGEYVFLAHEICRPKKMFATGAKLCEMAYEAQSPADRERLPDSAILAFRAAESGDDASENVETEERDRLVELGLDWLEFAIANIKRELESESVKRRSAAFEMLQQWRRRPVLSQLNGRFIRKKFRDDLRVRFRKLMRKVDRLAEELANAEQDESPRVSRS